MVYTFLPVRYLKKGRILRFCVRKKKEKKNIYIYTHIQEGLVLSQGYIPENRHANRTQNSQL